MALLEVGEWADKKTAGIDGEIAETTEGADVLAVSLVARDSCAKGENQ